MITLHCVLLAVEDDRDPEAIDPQQDESVNVHTCGTHLVYEVVTCPTWYRPIDCLCRVPG